MDLWSGARKDKELRMRETRTATTCFIDGQVALVAVREKDDKTINNILT